jgi:hypothetical protein
LLSRFVRQPPVSKVMRSEITGEPNNEMKNDMIGTML